MAQAIRPKKVTSQRRNLIALTGSRRMDPVEKAAEGRSELAGLGL